MQGADAGPLTRGLRLAGAFLLRLPRILALSLAGLWALLIWSLSAHEAPISPPSSSWWELLANLAHAPVFGVLTLFLAALLLREPGGGWPRARAAPGVLVLALVLAYAALDEWHQSRTPGRDSSVFDVLTDMVGAALVLWIVYTLGRRELRERQLLARFGAGLLLCLASAALATVV